MMRILLASSLSLALALNTTEPLANTTADRDDAAVPNPTRPAGLNETLVTGAELEQKAVPEHTTLPFGLMTTGGDVIYEYYGNVYAGAASNSANEEWRYRTETSQIIVSSNLQCLDAYKDSASGEYRVHTYKCDDINRNQYWTIDSARQRIKHRTHPNLCLDVDPTQNNKVQVWTCHDDAPNQRIMVTEDAVQLHTFNSRYLASHQRIARFVVVWGEPIEWIASTVDLTWRWSKRFFDSNECLDAYEPWNGGAVHVWPCDSNNGNQKWRFDPTTGQLRHATHTGFCLDMSTPDFNMPYGTRPYLWECNTPANNLQKFTYESLRFPNHDTVSSV